MVSMELLWGNKPKDCSGKVPVEPKKCCKDEAKTLQVDDAKQSFSDVQSEPLFSFIALLHPGAILEPLSQDFEKLPLNHLPNGPPPRSDSRPLYLLHSSLVI